jgi:hypothetical protein
MLLAGRGIVSGAAEELLIRGFGGEEWVRGPRCVALGAKNAEGDHGKQKDSDSALRGEASWLGGNHVRNLPAPDRVGNRDRVNDGIRLAKVGYGLGNAGWLPVGSVLRIAYRIGVLPAFHVSKTARRGAPRAKRGLRSREDLQHRREGRSPRKTMCSPLVYCLMCWIGARIARLGGAQRVT